MNSSSWPTTTKTTRQLQRRLCATISTCTSSPADRTENFYLLPGNAKVQLLARASVPKVSNPVPAPVAKPDTSKSPHPPKDIAARTRFAVRGAADSQTSSHPRSAASPAPHYGRLVACARLSGPHRPGLGNRLDVDVPNEIARYGEGQRFIGAWVLTKVTDPEASTPGHQVAEYLTVTAPLSSGLPFDFDEVRVFTWSLRHHRYETAFMLHPIQGFLPVRVGRQAPVQAASKAAEKGSSRATPSGSVPTFSFLIAGGQSISTDPATGISRPESPRTIRYEMLDTRIQRIGPDVAPIPFTHENGAEKKSKDQKAARKRRR